MLLILLLSLLNLSLCTIEIGENVGKNPQLCKSVKKKS